MSNSTAIAGLVNFGNTCYANALLQALGSCESYYEYLELLYKTFPVPRTHERSDASNWKANMPLTRSLFCTLERLQPAYDRRPLVASALEVLHGIGQHDKRLFNSFGEQQDVGEVLDCLASSCKSEIQAWGQTFLIDRLSIAPLSLRHEVQDDHIIKNTVGGLRSILPSELHSFHIEQFQSMGGFDGCLAHELDCCKCQHVFDMQFNPFTSLMLPISSVHTDGKSYHVDEEMGLMTCLRDFFSKKRQGPIRCPKCSFACTVSTELLDGVPRFGRSSKSSSLDRSSSDEEINNCSRRLSGLSDLLEAKERSMGGVVYRARASFDYKEFRNNHLKPTKSGGRWATVKQAIATAKDALFHDAHVQDITKKLNKVGIRWIDVDTDVNARTSIAKSPKVLVIALQRKVFDGVGYLKIEGRVRYPMMLDVAEFMKFKSVHTTKYRLKAVLVHQGNEEGGHYLTVRSVMSRNKEERRWLLASDDRVLWVSENAAMGLEASMLFYEREPDVTPSIPAAESFINLADI